VPVDDVSCYWFAIFTSFGAPIDKATMRAERLKVYELPDYLPRFNRRNDWGFDAEEQRTSTFTGMGHDINVHDQWAIESQGAIQDRTREHLGQSDKGIMLYRRMLLEAISRAEKGERPLMVLTPDEAARIAGPATVDGIGPGDAWQDYWREADARKRRASSWASSCAA